MLQHKIWLEDQEKKANERRNTQHKLY